MKKNVVVLVVICSSIFSSHAKEKPSKELVGTCSSISSGFTKEKPVKKEREKIVYMGFGLGGGTSLSNPNGRGGSYHLQFTAGARVHQTSHLNLGIFVSNFGRTAGADYGFGAYDLGDAIGTELTFRDLFDSGLYAGIRAGVVKRQLSEAFLGIIPWNNVSGFGFTGGPVIGYDVKFSKRFGMGTEMSAMYLSGVPGSGYWTGDSLKAEWMFSGLLNFKFFF